MAASGRRPDPSLIEALRAEPERFEFAQAIRILERAAAHAARDPRFATPGRVGSDDDPETETVLLRAALDLAFPTAEVAGLDDGGKKPELAVTVMGMHGPGGVLPGHYSQYVMEALRHKNTALRDFFDLFNHRALSLLARTSDKYSLPLSYERAAPGAADPISAALLALVGMRQASLKDRQALPDETVVFYAGHFSRRVRSAAPLGQMLSEYFEQPVRVRQFHGRWTHLPATEQSRLGVRRRNTLGQYQRLGVDAVMGARLFDVQGSIRIELGPLGYEEFKGFMPDGRRMAELRALTRTYVGPGLSFAVRLTLKGDEIPRAGLSNNPSLGSRLGWNTWLPARGSRTDARDAVFASDEL